MNIRRKNLIFLFVAIMLVAALAGCGNKAADPTPGPTESAQIQTPAASEQPAASPSPSEQPAFPVTIKDSTGTEITIEKEPQNIVSILPSATEIVFSLGAGSKVVGVSDWDNYPSEVKDIAKVGGLDVNTEKVVSLQPDLVLANSANGKAIDALRKLGLNVLVEDAANLQQVEDSIRVIGKAVGAADAAEQVVGKMEQQRDAVVNAVKDIPSDQKKKVWVEIDPTLYTAGSDTFINELIELAGGVNIAADAIGWPQYSEEKVLQANPDTILITYGDYIKDAANQVLARKTWSNVKAIQNKMVFEVNSDKVTRPGPRLMDGLREIAEKLYPDKFNQ